MAIKINGVTVIADTQAITTTSTISATGNILGGANLSVTGTITAAGVNTGSSPISTTGNVTGGNILTGGTVSATGAITGAALTGTSLTVTTGNITGGNLLLSGAIIDSAQLDIQTSASNSNIALAPNGTGVVTVSTQVSAVGNVTGGNIRTAGLISATGNITGGNVSATNLSGSLTTAAQANITSVGTLTSLNSGAISSSGNVTGANLLTAGLISSTGNITGGNVSATNLTGSLTTAAQANITSVGTLTSVSVTGNVQGGNIRTAGLVSATGDIIGGNLVINGNAQITGNLSVSGTETIFNVANLTVNDLDIIVANNVTGGANINGAGIQAGNPATATWFYNNATTSWQSNIGITPTANGTLSLGGASNFWGNAFLTTASVTGNVQGGNIRTAGLVSATGTVTGSQFNGSGAGLTSIPNGALSNSSVTLGSTALTLGATVTTVAGLSSVTSTTFVGALTGAATTAGTVTTAAQPNITSVGTLTSLNSGAISSSGNVTGANFLTGGLISATGAITGAALTGTSLTVSTGNITGGNLLLSGAILDSAQLDIQTTASNANIALAPNGTGVVTVSTQVSAVGNVTGGNIRTAGLISATGTVTGSQFNGSGAGLTSIPNGALTNSAVTVNGTAISLGGSGTVTAAAGTLTGTTLNATVVTTSITSTGALNSGSITSGFGAIDIGTDAITCGGIVNANANGVGNIGSSTTYFNTVFAKATSAQYADLAEKYTADAEYAPGTVVVFGGSAEVTVEATDGDRRVAGVVSTNPSYIMNAGCEGANVATVALTGRVPCFVTGPVRKGDLMVAAGLGRARAEADPRVGTVIGKALEDFDGESGTIEVVVGRF
jgi:hypothetical protein